MAYWKDETRQCAICGAFFRGRPSEEACDEDKAALARMKTQAKMEKAVDEAWERNKY